jgi:hypothetical protein
VLVEVVVDVVVDVEVVVEVEVTVVEVEVVVDVEVVVEVVVLVEVVVDVEVVVEVVVTTIEFMPKTFCESTDTAFAVNLKVPMTLASVGNVKLMLFVVPELLTIAANMMLAVFVLVIR